MTIAIQKIRAWTVQHVSALISATFASVRQDSRDRNAKVCRWNFLDFCEMFKNFQRQHYQRSLRSEMFLFFFNLKATDEANPCALHPCLNGGTCYDQRNSQSALLQLNGLETFKCFCMRGYSGTNCEGCSNIS